jgi:hypothetical protein
MCIYSLLNLLSYLRSRYKLTWPSHEPTNMQHLKHYVDFLITSTIPKLGEEPDQDSIRGKVRRFCNAWERKYNSTIPSSIKESMAPVSNFKHSKFILVFKAYYISLL